MQGFLVQQQILAFTVPGAFTKGLGVGWVGSLHGWVRPVEQPLNNRRVPHQRGWVIPPLELRGTGAAYRLLSSQGLPDFRGGL